MALFGSYGRGDAGVGSDLDLLLIDAGSTAPSTSGSAMAAALQRDSRWLWHR